MNMQQVWTWVRMRSWCVWREPKGCKWCVALEATPWICRPLAGGLQNMTSRLWEWKVPECTGSHCSRNWREEAFTALSSVPGHSAEWPDAKAMWWTASGSKHYIRMDYWKAPFAPKQTLLLCAHSCAIAPN